MSRLPAVQPDQTAFIHPPLNSFDTLLPTYKACLDCHGSDPEKVASVTKSGKDINVVHDWQVSMKAFAAKDPLWRAQMEYELLEHDSSSLDNCLRCHAPAAYHKALFEGRSFKLGDLTADSLALEGVQCASCHQMSTFDAVNGQHLYASDGTMKGPYTQPFSGPMEDLFGWPVEYDPHMRTSEACKSCHTVLIEKSDGNIIAEQATYYEWLHSDFEKEQKECQSCHMPYVFDSVKLATEYPFIEGRSPFARHQFLGANHWMLKAMREEFDTTANDIPDPVWEDRFPAHENFLKNSAEINILNSTLGLDNHILVDVEVINHSGHKFPTAYPSRKAVAEILAIHTVNGDTVFHSGDPQKVLAGVDKQAHFNSITQQDQAQIYEFLTLDSDGQTNYSLLSAHSIIKDNRIPPRGFRAYQNDTFGIKGFASADPDYQNGSGRDRIQYLIGFDEDGAYEIQVHLYYLNITQDWLHALTRTKHPLALAIQSYSQREPPLTYIDGDTVLQYMTSINDPLSGDGIRLFPNPVRAGKQINVSLKDDIHSLRIINLQGLQVSLKQVGESVLLPGDLQPGVYLLIVNEEYIKRLVIESVDN